MAYSLGRVPKRPVVRVRARVFGAAATSATSLSTRVKTSSKSTFCASPSDSVSCTTAIADTRRIAWVSASRASSVCERRAWMRSSEATVCRLFFTRWWISRIVASLVMSSCSWWRISVTSRQSTIAPMRLPRSRRGIVRRLTVTPRDSRSARQGARPVSDDGKRFVELTLRRQDAGHDLDERLALELVIETQPVERREPVGARECRDAVRVQPDEAVRRARRTTARGRRRGEIREVAGRDHAEQLIRAVVERDLLPRRRPRLAEVRVPRQDPDASAACRP